MTDPTLPVPYPSRQTQAPLTTGEIAKLVNAAVGSRVYNDRTIRAEIDAGYLRAARNSFRAKRRSILVTEHEFLRWATDTLGAEEYQRLLCSMGNVERAQHA